MLTIVANATGCDNRIVQLLALPAAWPAWPAAARDGSIAVRSLSFWHPTSAPDSEGLVPQLTATTNLLSGDKELRTFSPEACSSRMCRIMPVHCAAVHGSAEPYRIASFFGGRTMRLVRFVLHPLIAHTSTSTSQIPGCPGAFERHRGAVGPPHHSPGVL